MNKIIIFKEPFKEYAFDASTEELLALACVKTLTRRSKDRSYRYFAKGRKFTPTETELFYLNISEEEIEALPFEFRQKTKEKKNRLTNLQENVKRERQHIALWHEHLAYLLSLPLAEQVQATIKNSLQKEENLAYWLIKQRNAYAGEGFNILQLEQ